MMSYEALCSAAGVILFPGNGLSHRGKALERQLVTPNGGASLKPIENCFVRVPGSIRSNCSTIQMEVHATKHPTLIEVSRSRGCV